MLGSGCSKPSSVGLLRCVRVGFLLEAVLPHTPGENLQINMVLLVGWRNRLPPSCPHAQHKTSENEMRQDCPGKSPYLSASHQQPCGFFSFTVGSVNYRSHMTSRGGSAICQCLVIRCLLCAISPTDCFQSKYNTILPKRIGTVHENGHK